MTWVALRMISAGAPDGVEQLVGRQPEPDVHLVAGGAHGLEPAVGDLLGDQDAFAPSAIEAIRGSGRSPERIPP